jgi:co-chaperonin GroES (HSP10)
VLPDDEAEKLNKVVVSRKKNQRLSGGVASPSPAKKKKKKAKVIKEEAVDPDMQTSGADRVGSAVL